MPLFTPEEKELLSKYVTDTEGDIYCISGADGIVGAAYARYSRAKGGFRETFLKEFVQEGVLNPAKAQQLLRRVLIAFGDDSVGELEGAHLSLENISILATKEWEDRRIGGSPIEQSTRYVFYDQKDAEGNYRYYRDPAIMSSPLAAQYVETMDFVFDTYCALIEPMKQYYSGIKPMDEAEYDINGDGAKEKLADVAGDEKLAKAFRVTYDADIRTKACDTLRALLPLATKTNVGLFGNGRFYQHALSHCLTSDLPEARDIAERAKAQLEKVVPLYVERAKKNDYLAQTRSDMAALAAELFAGVAPVRAEQDISLVGDATCNIAEACKDAPGDENVLFRAMQAEKDNTTIAHMLYPHLSHPFRQIRETVRAMTPETKQRVIATYIGNRTSRRDRPGRAFEAGYPYTFDLVVDFGTYKDLERHRMLTEQRQQFTPTLGFAMPEDLLAAGHAERAQQCVDRIVSLHASLAAEFPALAQYAVLHGSLVRWVIGINDRALMHMLELRTQPAGHPAYRKACQEMHKLVRQRSAWRGEAMQYVDHGDYFWARGASEARQRVKEAALEKQHGS